MDPKKTRAMISAYDDKFHADGQEADQHPDDPEGDMSAEAQDHRKMEPYVEYMEVEEDAGAFACGNCTFARAHDDGNDDEEDAPEEDRVGSCLHPKVRGDVALDHGCCNLFHPDGESVHVVFPLEPSEPDEDQEDEEDDENEDA